jgi:uncharacterized protein (DUF2225 family)
LGICSFLQIVMQTDLINVRIFPTFFKVTICLECMFVVYRLAAAQIKV